MIEKYEFFIQENFDPYAAMHESRPHSNLWGKMVLWGDEALKTDHVGFYSKNRLIDGEPTPGDYHEEFPHQVQAWMYDEKYLNTDFDYSDVEGKYQQSQEKSTVSKEELKKKLDSHH